MEKVVKSCVNNEPDIHPTTISSTTIYRYSHTRLSPLLELVSFVRIYTYTYINKYAYIHVYIHISRLQNFGVI